MGVLAVAIGKSKSESERERKGSGRGEGRGDGWKGEPVFVLCIAVGHIEFRISTLGLPRIARDCDDRMFRK